MKHLPRAALVALTLTVVLTGCIDIEQHVTAEPGGGVRTFIRFAFDKALFELTAQMSGEAVDYDEMLAEADLEQDDLFSELPSGVEAIYRPVNTAARFGFDAELAVPARLARAPFTSTAAAAGNEAVERTFFPYRYEGGLVIPVEGIGEAEQESEAFLASAEYSLSIGSSMMSSIGAVHVLAPGEAPGPANRLDIEARDYRDYMLLAIPMTAFTGEGTRLLVVLP